MSVEGRVVEFDCSNDGKTGARRAETETAGAGKQVDDSPSIHGRSGTPPVIVSPTATNQGLITQRPRTPDCRPSDP